VIPELLAGSILIWRMPDFSSPMNRSQALPACILNPVAARDLAPRRRAGGGSEFRSEFFHAFAGQAFLRQRPS
jgi:hypothetical protein